MLTGHTLKIIQILGHPPVMFSLSPSLKLQIQKPSKVRAGIILGGYLFQLPTPFFSPNGLVTGQVVPDDMQTKAELGREPKL